MASTSKTLAVTITRLASAAKQAQSPASASAVLAFRMLLELIPQLSQQIFLLRDKAETAELAAEGIRLLAIIESNLNDKDAFASSHFYKEALRAFQEERLNGDVEEVLNAR